MSDFTVVLEHADACGLVGEKKVKASFLNAASAVLLCRGASKILIPAPGEHEFERVSVGIEDMPKERRGAIQIVDRKGAILRKVYDYIAPLKEQANKWPEDAYVQFLEGFLYQVGIASKYKAGIIGDTVQTLRGFIPIINPMLFKGEARYRLAETIDLVCRYEPTRPNHGMLHYEIAEKGISEKLWSIIETAEFRSIVAESGKLGYIKNPLIGIKKISNLFADLIRKPQVKPILSIAHTAAELSGLGIPADSVERIIGEVEEQQKEGRSFSPPFISLGPAELPIYRIALAERYPGAIPPKNSISLFEHSRDSRINISWLNVGEKKKLEKEAKSGLKHELSLLAKCKRVQSQFYG
jgi:hypothetical protein